MKSVIGWLKGHWLVVLFAIIMVAAPVAGFFFSSSWNAQIKERQESAYRDSKSELDRASRVSYSLPSVEPGMEAIELDVPPNAALTRYFAEQRDRLASEVDAVVEQGTAFNRRPADTIVQGLFPPPEDEKSARRLTLDMARAIVGSEDDPSYYAGLISSFDAAGPPDPSEIGRRLDAVKEREEDRLLAASQSGRGEIDAEARRQLASTLVEHRIGEYGQHANEFSFYASMEALRGSEEGMRGVIEAVPAGQISVDQAFVWQWDSWIITDLLRAVSAANQDISGGGTSIINAPVKRVESILIDPVDLGSAAAQSTRGGGGWGGGGGASGGDETSSAVTHTGRSNAAGDSTYEVRNARMTVVVASAKLPILFDAIGRVNFMTVTGVSTEQVDVWEDLREGYYYGDEHVVRVTIDVETVWLHDWMSPLMPQSLRQTLGVAAPTRTGEDEG